jgi:hypothetical protein
MSLPYKRRIIKRLNIKREPLISREGVAVAIFTTLLLWFTAFPLSFAQQTTSDLFLGISPNMIDLGDTVFVRVSVILEANSTSDMVIRFIPPQGTVQEYQFHFQASSASPLSSLNSLSFFGNAPSCLHIQ